MKLKVYLTRIYRFSSAHRLYSPRLTEEENRAVFGNCGNPKGHGHNYILEVTISGIPDPLTGMVIRRQNLDRIVEDKIIQPWDHRHLDEDTADFKGNFSTGEVITRTVWEKLRSCLEGASLSKIKLWETSSSFFEYFEKDIETVL
ncbi:MAG: 6-carboxytetrahydropterin synthase [Firmicutes bacterium]|nr:6-carboxytetrahydropterin synthase [Bacillota bacterium]